MNRMMETGILAVVVGLAGLMHCDFDVAEILGYESALSFEEENLVGAYLSRKYNLSTAYVPAGDYDTWAANYPGYNLTDPGAEQGHG